jgi:hypothetical protein
MHNHHEDSTDRCPKQPPKDRVIEHFCFYMSHISNSDEQLVMPLSYYAKVTSKDYLTITRSYPALFAPGKLESRLLQETGMGLDYKGDDMLFTILFAMVLSKALEPMLETSDDVTQILIPQQHGIFIGSARRNLPYREGQSSANIYMISSASRTKNPKNEAYLDPDFEVTSKIVSFVPFRKMNPNQLIIHQHLDELRQDKNFMQDMALSFESLSRPLLYKPEELAKRGEVFKNAVGRVAEIIGSSIWRNECTLRKNYYNGHGRASTNSL